METAEELSLRILCSQEKSQECCTLLSILPGAAMFEQVLSDASAAVIGTLLGVVVTRMTRLVPSALKRKFTILLYCLYSVVLTFVLTLLALLGSSLSWAVVALFSFFSWCVSAWLTRHVARTNGEPLDDADSPAGTTPPTK